MYNFNFNVNDYFENMPTGIWAIGIFIGIVLVIAIIALYVFSSLGIMNLANKNKIPNAWLAFVPCARYYIVGKLGFEIYAQEDKKNQYLTWILFGLSIGALVFATHDYADLLKIAVTVFNAIAFYNIFKVVTPKNVTSYTVWTVLLENLGGTFLYYRRSEILNSNEEIKEEKEETKSKEEKKNEDIEPKVKKAKTESKPRPNFCPNCGSKLSKTAKFCGNCGEEIK